MIREPEFAKRVAECREKRNLSLSECARLMHVTRQQFGNWESGLCKPKGERLKQLATVLQCDSVWLQHGESSELEQHLETAMLLMRSVVRHLDHIHKALGENAKKSRGIADPAICTLLEVHDDRSGGPNTCQPNSMNSTNNSNVPTPAYATPTIPK